MQYRTVLYLKRKKAFKAVLHPADLKSLLKAEFFSTNNFMVKRHILKVYETLKQPATMEA